MLNVNFCAFSVTKGMIAIMIKNVIKKIILREKYDSKSFIRYLVKKGLKIGNDTTIFVPRNTYVDITRPWLITIGNNVKISNGVTILTHGYDWSVLRIKYKEILGSAGPVKIGNNVFIGMNTTILKNTYIGNNVVIGANSLVTGVIPDDVVIAGNPAKTIMTLEQYYDKRKKAYINEGKLCVNEYFQRYKRIPKIAECKEFFPLFLKMNINEIKKYPFFQKQIAGFKNTDNIYINEFLKSKPVFDNYDEFIKFCIKDNVEKITR